jgi:hypothetical protein
VEGARACDEGSYLSLWVCLNLSTILWKFRKKLEGVKSSMIPGLLAFRLFYQGPFRLSEPRLDSGWIREGIRLGLSSSTSSSQCHPFNSTWGITPGALRTSSHAPFWQQLVLHSLVSGRLTLPSFGCKPGMIRINLVLLECNKCFWLEVDLAHNSNI